MKPARPACYRRRTISYRLCVLLLPILLLSGLPLDAANPAQPPAPGFFGMNTYFTGLERLSRDEEEGTAALVQLGRQAGIRWAREELSWGNLERNGKGRWEWKLFDQRLRQMADAGYGITGMLLTTPKWARVADCRQRIERYAAYGVTTQDYWCPPANPADFADYVRATVERYDGDGNHDAPGSPRVAAWQIGNEPNHWETWPGSPAEYAAILRAGYAAAKAADPTAIVATGGLYVIDGSWSDGIGHNDGLAFMDAVLAADPAAWSAFDALAIHPFMPDVAPDQPGILASVTLWGRIQTSQNWLVERTARYGGPLRPLWISEIGWSNCGITEIDCYIGGAALSSMQPDYRASLGHQAFPPPLAEDETALQGLVFMGKTEDQQANYMLRAHAIARALGVAHLSYFQFEDKFDGSARNFWEEASLLRPRSSGYQPRAAYHAYTAMQQQIGNAQYLGLGPLHNYAYNPAASANPAAVYHLRFLSPDNVIIELLWSSGAPVAVRLGLEPGRTARLIDRDGGAIGLEIAADGSAALTLSERPLYLRQSAPPQMAVSPTAITRLREVGTAPFRIQLTVGNRGSGALNWTAGSNSPWLNIINRRGRGWSEPLTVEILPQDLPAGRHQASLIVTSEAGNQIIPITLVISEEIFRQYLPIVPLTQPWPATQKSKTVVAE